MSLLRLSTLTQCTPRITRNRQVDTSVADKRQNSGSVAPLMAVDDLVLVLLLFLLLSLLLLLFLSLLLQLLQLLLVLLLFNIEIRN